MEQLVNWLPYLLGGVILVCVLFLFRRYLGWLMRLSARTAVGLGALALFSNVSGYLGISLGVNLFNALVLALLGVPGFGLLLMLRWTCLT